MDDVPTLAYAVMRVCGGQPRKNPSAPIWYITMKEGLDRFNQHLEIITFAKARDVYKE